MTKELQFKVKEVIVENVMNCCFKDTIFEVFIIAIRFLLLIYLLLVRKRDLLNLIV